MALHPRGHYDRPRLRQRLHPRRDVRNVTVDFAGRVYDRRCWTGFGNLAAVAYRSKVVSALLISRRALPAKTHALRGSRTLDDRTAAPPPTCGQPSYLRSACSNVCRSLETAV